MSIQQSLFAYIRSHGYSLHDAEDLLQAASVALWQEYPSYAPVRPFLPWALAITRNVVRKQARYDRIRSSVRISSSLCEKISDCVEATLQQAPESFFAREKERMEKCLETLPGYSKTLLRLRYEQGLDLPAVARQVGKSYAATNMILTRIRKLLLACVSVRLEGAAQ